MKDVLDALHRVPDGATVADVGDHDVERTVHLAQPRQVPVDVRSREIVENAYALTGRQQPVDEVGTDESGASGDERRHSASPRDSSSARATATRSDATCPFSQCASSRSPSSKSTRAS